MSKALGHALEGYIRGMTEHLCAEHSSKQTQYIVKRSLPVSLTMNTDVVVFEKTHGKTLPFSLLLVFKSDKIGTSAMKWKRTRQEYIESEILKLGKHKSFLHPKYNTICCVFGHGWKPEIIADLKNHLYPTLFFPTILGKDKHDELCAKVLSLYLKYKHNATAELAKFIKDNARQTPHYNIVKSALEGAIWGRRSKTVSAVVRAEHARKSDSPLDGRVPSSSVSSRFCHGLGLLSGFSNEEVGALYRLYYCGEAFALEAALQDPLVTASLQRAIFVGIAQIRPEGKKGFRILWRSRVAVDDLDVSYVFNRLHKDACVAIIDKMKAISKANEKTYLGSVSALRFTHLESVLPIARKLIMQLEQMLEGCDKGLYSLAGDVTETRCHTNCYDGKTGGIKTAWSLMVAAATVFSKDRSLTIKYAFGGDKPGEPNSVKAIVSILRNKCPDLTLGLCNEMKSWIDAIENGNWMRISTMKAPIFLDIDEPSSWLQWHYNVIAAHYASNFPNLVAKECLADKECVLTTGFPAKRGIPIKKALGYGGRSHLRIVGKTDTKVISYEGKCITANHIGDKSKELFDRVGDFKRACAAAGMNGEAVLVVDGDFSEEALLQLASADAYDRIYSMDELLHLKT